MLKIFFGGYMFVWLGFFKNKIYSLLKGNILIEGPRKKKK